MKFAAFFMAEYANMITITAMTTVLFLGGWQPLFSPALGSNFVPTIIFAGAGGIALYHALNPARRRDRFTLPVFAILFFGLGVLFLIPMLQEALLPLFWFAAKTGFLLFTFIWVRGTLPRFRYDQLMAFAWKFMFPLAVLNLVVTGFIVAWKLS
jgi:NADH-quinone oxidoreductase subunit H